MERFDRVFLNSLIAGMLAFGAAACANDGTAPAKSLRPQLELERRTWQNEPAGWNVITDYAFDSVIPTGSGVPMGDNSGWGITQASPAKVSRVSDGSAPLSPSNVAQFFYPTDFPSGVAPGTMYYTIPSPPYPDALYVGFWWKPSNPWQGNDSNVSKLLFIWFAGVTGNDMLQNYNLQMHMYGPPGGPYATRMVGEGWEDVSYTENVGSSSPLALDVWHKIEILINEPAEALKWWVDGVLVGSYTSVPRRVSSPGTSLPYPTPFSKELVHISPTFGGNGSAKAEDDYFWYDHIHISAPSAGLSSASVSDNFNRANETPIASPWRAVENTVRLYENAAVGGGFAVRNVARYGGAGLTANQEAQVILRGTPLSHGEYYLGPCVRVAGNAATYYAFATDDTEGALLEVVDGTVTVLARGGSPGHDGDVLRLRVVGSTITGYINNDQQLTATNGDITSGDPGLLVHSNYTPTSLDDFVARSVN